MSGIVDISGTYRGEQFIFQCPRCSHARAWHSEQVRSNADSSIDDRCPNCGGGYRVWKPGSEPLVSDPTAVVEARQDPQHASPGTNSSLVGRYADAYLTARATNGIGQAVKIAGLVLGALVALVATLTAAKFGSGPAGALGGILLGAVTALPAYVLGVIVSAQGQILKATLDTAVNSSPFLSHADIRNIQTL